MLSEFARECANKNFPSFSRFYQFFFRPVHFLVFFPFVRIRNENNSSDAARGFDVELKSTFTFAHVKEMTRPALSGLIRTHSDVSHCHVGGVHSVSFRGNMHMGDSQSGVRDSARDRVSVGKSIDFRPDRFSEMIVIDMVIRPRETRSLQDRSWRDPARILVLDNNKSRARDGRSQTEKPIETSRGASRVSCIACIWSRASAEIFIFPLSRNDVITNVSELRLARAASVDERRESSALVRRPFR